MSGWKMDNVKVEEILDTDPGLYKDRAKKALWNGQYREAIQETKMALKYGNNDIRYHMLMTEILFKMQEYRQCLEYIRQQRMIDYFFTEIYRSDTNDPMLMSFFEEYLECWKHIGGDISEADVIIVIEDGTGMVKTLQDAIDTKCKCRRIYFKNMGENEGVAGIVDGKDLCIIISSDLALNREKAVKKYSPHIIINSGNVHFINSDLHLDEYNVGVEINGGNVLFENVYFSGGYYTNLIQRFQKIYSETKSETKCTSVGVYVKNQATVNMRCCRSGGRIIYLYAECGEIDLRDSCTDAIAVIGKRGKASLNLLNCRDLNDDGVLVGYNTVCKIKDCEYSYITLEAKLSMDCQDNLVMNVYGSSIARCAAAYNGGILYLYNSKSKKGSAISLEADNGKILCENFRNEGKTIELRPGIGKNTEIICDCDYKVVNEVEKAFRMGTVLNEIDWLIKN